jgi:prepilin-type N-terminal cleavage/methylation domain-containing protein
MKKNFQGQEGLTLIEVLVSVVLLSIILTSFLGFFTQSAIFNKKNNEKLDTIQTAQKIKNQVNINITKNILINDRIIDSTGNIITNPPKLNDSYLKKYFDPQTTYNYWVELMNSNIRNPTTKSSINLIQFKIIVQDQKDNNRQSVTYTYIR